MSFDTLTVDRQELVIKRSEPIAPYTTFGIGGPADIFVTVRHASEVADAVIAAVPVSDTIKEVSADGQTVSRTLDRRKLWAVQTPQVFRRESLERALGDDELVAHATDDAWLIEQQGGMVRMIDSCQPNLKVTTADDLRVAELLLSER